jgi:hypothetical protein
MIFQMSWADKGNPDLVRREATEYGYEYAFARAYQVEVRIRFLIGKVAKY